MLPPAYLRQKLARPLPVKGGPTLRTVQCVCNYMFTLPDGHVEGCNRWSRTAALLLEQADVAAVSRQVHLSLFYEARLDLKRTVGEQQAEQYNRAGRLDYSWYGLARYWRKKLAQ